MVAASTTSTRTPCLASWVGSSSSSRPVTTTCSTWVEPESAAGPWPAASAGEPTHSVAVAAQAKSSVFIGYPLTGAPNRAA